MSTITPDRAASCRAIKPRSPRMRVQMRDLEVSLASTPDQIEESQRLRFAVFAGELGARLEGDGIDADRFDPHCRHLLVRDTATSRLVASTRLLDTVGATAAGSFYSETEFELDTIRARFPRILEIGRTCVHPGYRRGAAISVLWSGLARLANIGDHDAVIGCASIPLGEGGGAWAAWDHIQARGLVRDDLGVEPRRPFVARGRAGLAANVPPLLAAYLRLGAKVCGDPCWDPDFDTADLLVLLLPRELKDRYARHFLR